jgi:outer membrane receptor protein involved in Fe transport
MSLVKTAFLDTERVEILRGPQPLHFGMNATAGAFNIQSARPTDTWQGNVGAEFGNFGKKEVSGAIGGPISETLGIRIAGIFEGDDGPVFNRYNPGERLPKFEHIGGRASLVWTPREDLTIFTKIERSRQRNGSQLTMGCLTGAPLSGFGNDFLRNDDEGLRGLFGNEQSVFAEPPIGTGVLDGIIPPEVFSGDDCFDGNLAFANGGPYSITPSNVVSQQSSRRAQDGSVDSRGLLSAFYSGDGGASVPGVGGADHGGNQGIVGKDWIDTWNGLFDVEYELSNGIALTSETGWVKLDRLASRDFRISPFLLGYQPKEENYQQFSQLFRIDSPADGVQMSDDVNVEYMGQLFYQQSGLEFWNGNSEAGALRRPMRFNNGWEKSKWYAASWNLTFNFMENQLSLSVGGRYTDIKKNVRIGGWGAAHIFDQVPCADERESADGNEDPATCTIDSDFTQIDLTLTDPTFADPTRDPDDRVRIDNPQILLDGADLTNLWTTTRWGSRQGVPLNYRDGRVPAVGFTAPNYQNNIPEPWLEEQNADDYNSQIVLSYTPNALEGNHTFYTKYVEAFKGPVTDTGQGGLPLTFEELAFAREFVKAYELGAKGTLMDGRIRYDWDIFRNDFSDLQTVGAAVVGNIQDQNSVSLNAGKQRVDGIEFSFQYAATEHLTLNVAGSLLDAKFLQFDGDGCSSDEIYASAIEVLANPGAYGPARIQAAQGRIDNLEPDIQALLPARGAIDPVYYENQLCRLVDTTAFDSGTINRRGVVPQDAPDWKFVLGANYAYPILDTVEAFLNVKGFISDDFRTGRAANPAATVFFDRGGDMNLSFGLNSSDGSWRLAAYVRNIFEFKPSYHPENEVIPNGLITTPLSTNSFTSYGIRMEYNYQ